MTKRKKTEPVMPTASWRLLGDIQDALARQAKSGKAMERHQAAAYAHVLQRLRKDERLISALAAYDKPDNLNSPNLRRKTLAYYVLLVRKLIGNGAVQFVVDHWQHTNEQISSVRTYCRDEKGYTQAMWARAKLFGGERTDKETALAELESWELKAPDSQQIWDAGAKKSS